MREAAEQLAWAVLVRAAVTRPPVDVDAVAASVGLRFDHMDFTATLGAYVRGFDRAMIGSRQHPLRQRFTKAHELAHHLIDEPTGWVARMQLPLPPRGTYAGVDYHEAHEFFAASLLMPRPWIRHLERATWRSRDIADVARRFGVTKIAAAVRLGELYGCRSFDYVVDADGDRRSLYALA